MPRTVVICNMGSRKCEGDQDVGITFLLCHAPDTSAFYHPSCPGLHNLIYLALFVHGRQIKHQDAGGVSQFGSSDKLGLPRAREGLISRAKIVVPLLLMEWRCLDPCATAQANNVGQGLSSPESRQQVRSAMAWTYFWVEEGRQTCRYMYQAADTRQSWAFQRAKFKTAGQDGSRAEAGQGTERPPCASLHLSTRQSLPGAGAAKGSSSMSIDRERSNLYSFTT